MRSDRIERVALIAIAALLLAGCLSLMEGETVSTHAQTLPESERAVLLGRSEWFLLYAFDESIWSVDGVIGSGAGERRWEVAPGRHAVEIDQWDMFGGMGGKARYGFELEMRAGHRYQIQGVRQQPGCVVEIEELRPGQEAGTVMQVPCEERLGTGALTGGNRGGGAGCVGSRSCGGRRGKPRPDLVWQEAARGPRSTSRLERSTNGQWNWRAPRARA